MKKDTNFVVFSSDPSPVGGFWTGVGAGGVIGYLLGRQRSVKRRKMGITGLRSTFLSHFMFSHLVYLTAASPAITTTPTSPTTYVLLQESPCPLGPAWLQVTGQFKGHSDRLLTFALTLQHVRQIWATGTAFVVLSLYTNTVNQTFSFNSGFFTEALLKHSPTFSEVQN